MIPGDVTVVDKPKYTPSTSSFQAVYPLAEQVIELESTNSGRLNVGVLPSEISADTVVKAISVAGCGTRVVVAQVSLPGN